jgi:hypothetical protein
MVVLLCVGLHVRYSVRLCNSSDCAVVDIAFSRTCHLTDRFIDGRDHWSLIQLVLHLALLSLNYLLVALLSTNKLALLIPQIVPKSIKRTAPLRLFLTLPLASPTRPVPDPAQIHALRGPPTRNHTAPTDIRRARDVVTNQRTAAAALAADGFAAPAETDKEQDGDEEQQAQ